MKCARPRVRLPTRSRTTGFIIIIFDRAGGHNIYSTPCKALRHPLDIQYEAFVVDETLYRVRSSFFVRERTTRCAWTPRLYTCSRLSLLLELCTNVLGKNSFNVEEKTRLYEKIHVGKNEQRTCLSTSKEISLYGNASTIMVLDFTKIMYFPDVQRTQARWCC